MKPLSFAWCPGRLAREDGTTAIEFAIVGLVFFALLLGSIELARLMWVRNSLQFAAEEAVRWELVKLTNDPTQIQDRARGKLTSSPLEATITATFETVSGKKYVVVTATQAFQPVTTLVSIGAVTIRGRARMPVG